MESYEKKYKEALEKAQKALEVCGTDKCETARQIFSLFPELRESEDEKIKKHIISVLEDAWQTCKNIDYDSSRIQEDIAWLEKQGEQKVPVVDFKAEDWYVSKVDGKIHNATFMEKTPTNQASEKQGEPGLSKDLGEYIAELSKQFPEVSFAKLSRIAVRVKNWLEKQEGCEYIKKDWLEHIKQSWYKEGFIDGKYGGGTSKEWTINDAAILKEIIDFLENGTAKLQHDLTKYANWLKIQFAPIEKQGEQFSDDKLEPKFKVGDVMRTLQEAANNITSGLPVVVSIDEEYYHCTNELIAIKDQDDYEYPPMNRAIAWSEEDEDYYDAIIAKLEVTQDGAALTDNQMEFLKSLKSRVQPKQEWKQENTDDLTDFENAMMHIGGSFFGKNAGLDPNDTNAIKEQAKLLLELTNTHKWSEEDEENFRDIIGAIHSVAYQTTEDEESRIDWLKSLKSRVQHKPELGKEDKEHIESILKRLDGMCKKGATFTETRFAVNQDMDWLKSLKKTLWN